MKISIEKIAIILFAFIFISTIKAQPDPKPLFSGRDTIFVYDTLVIVDTIRISRSPIDFKDLEKLSSKKLSYLEVKNTHSNEKLFIFSNGQTATLSDSNIKSVNNNFNSNNSDEMKKIGFLSVMLFAFQNMVLAQNDVGIYLGGGAYNLLVVEEANTNFVPTVQLGASYLQPFAKDKLFVNTRLNYSYLSNNQFEGIDSISTSTVEFPAGTDITDIVGVIPPELFNTSLEAAQIEYYASVVSLQLTLGLNGKGFRPFVGLESFLKEDYYLAKSENANGNFQNKIGVSGTTIGASAILGFQIPFSKRWGLNASYARQFTTDRDIVSGINQVLPGQGKDTKFQRLDVSIRYRLFKKKEKSARN